MPYLNAVHQTVRAYAWSPPEKLPPRIKIIPFKINQGHRNWHGSISYL